MVCCARTASSLAPVICCMPANRDATVLFFGWGANQTCSAGCCQPAAIAHIPCAQILVTMTPLTADSA